MNEKETVYRIRYTADFRVKSVHASEQPKANERRRTLLAWLFVVLGALVGYWWYVLWA